MLLENDILDSEFVKHHKYQEQAINQGRKYPENLYNKLHKAFSPSQALNISIYRKHVQRANCGRMIKKLYKFHFLEEIHRSIEFSRPYAMTSSISKFKTKIP